MARTGRPPQPATVSRLTGRTKRDKATAKRADAEPRCTVRPVPPPTLDGVALQQWHRLMEVSPPGLYTAMDEPLLIAFCETWATREMLKRQMTKTGLAKGSTGQTVLHPVVAAITAQTKLLVQMGQKLALSPADRASMGVHLTKMAPPVDDSSDGASSPAGALSGLIGRGARRA